MRILVVDDEREFALLMSKVLERLGHDSIVESDPARALTIAADPARGVAGVITDLEMPGMTGVDLARAIRAEVDGEMPIAFCTGSDPSDRITRDAAEIGPVLTKGAPLRETREVIRAMVSLWTRPRP